MNINRLSIIKFLELALTCTCVGLHYESYNPEPGVGMLVTGTFVGFLIIFAGSAAGYILKAAVDKKVDIFYSVVGVCLFIASGAVIIDRYQNVWSSRYKNYNMAKASLAIINGAVLLLDAVLTHRGG